MEARVRQHPQHLCFLAPMIYPTFVGSTTIQVAGGGEVQQTVLAKVLHNSGLRVSVITGDYGQPDLLTHDGIDVFKIPPIGTRGFKGLRKIYPAMGDIVSTLRRVNPDIVYMCVGGYHAAAAAWYARSEGRQFVYQCGSDREFLVPIPGMSWRDSAMFRWGLRRAHKIIVQNIIQRDQFLKNYGRLGVIIPTLYREDGAARARAGGSILWVGTLKPIKRADLFIELARRLTDQEFVMVGGPDHSNDAGLTYYNRMRASAFEVKNLRFMGHIPFSEVGAYFDKASLLVNTSDSEGFPNTFMQAWIRGIPTLSFVAPEVSPGKTGTIRCSDFDDMTNKVHSLATSSILWTCASVSAYENFLNSHSTSAVLPLYQSLFDSLLHSTASRFAGSEFSAVP
jgi:glycosyltransferase involved in cell wall biosynthesis